MWLLADVGTSNAKFYRWDGSSFEIVLKVPSHRLDEGVWLRFKEYRVKVGFSVRPDVAFPKDWVVVGRDEPWGFNVKVDLSTVGVDRLLAVEGAVSLGVRDGLVAMFGTANVVNVLRSGSFVGGGIAPGFELMRRALISGIPHLSSFVPQIPQKPVGASTPLALGAGLYWSHLMWLVGLRDYLEINRVLVTGGGAEAVKELLGRLGFEFVPHLVPIGMVSVMKKKKGGL